MKKCTYLLMLVLLLCSLYACGTKPDDTNKDAEASAAVLRYQQQR